MGTGSSKKKKIESNQIESKQTDENNTKTLRKESRSKSNIKQTVEETPRRKPPKGVRKQPATQERRKSDNKPDLGQFVPYEAENLILEGDWEIEKGIDEETLPTDVTYPPPSPPKPFTETSLYSAVDFQIMKNNIDEPKLANGTFEEVASHLTRDLKLDILKVRALVTWISLQKIRTRQYGPETKPGTVLGYMQKIKGRKGTFAGLLTLLCRAIEIPCVIVKGIYKSNVHKVGEDDVKTSHSTWNVVYVDESWQIVHPFLICTPLSTKTPTENWKLVESSVDAPEQKPGSVLNTFFFAPKPDEFAYFCMPIDTKAIWQLLETKIKYAKFIKTPFLRPAFFSTGMKLQSDQACVLLSEGGKCNIKIQCQQSNVSEIELMYELYSYEPDFEKDEDWGDLVLCGRNEDTWNVQIKFPVDGTFKLALFAKLKDWFFWIGDFKIVCDVGLNHFVATPAVPRDIGLGPSKVSEEAGLLAPSHEGGIVFYKPDEDHVIKFLLSRKIVLSYELEHSEIDSEELQNHCKMVMRRTEVDFIVNLPITGEFALRIYKVDEQGDEHNICNYLFTDAFDSRKREDLFQRRARAKLRESTAGHDIEVLEHAIDKFASVKLPQDDDYIRGVRRLKYLKLKKGLRDGRMRRHEGTLLKAVDDAEESNFRQVLEPNINSARNVLEGIQSLEVHNHPVLAMDHPTISEIANLAHPPREVHAVMTSVYLLLGEDKQFLQKWGNIQALLRRQGKEGIKHRINDFKNQPMPSKATIQAVQKLHNSVPDHYSLASSLSAYTFHQWVSNMLSHLNNSSQNATETENSFMELEDNGYSNDPYYIMERADDVTDVNDDVRAGKAMEGDGDISQDEGFLDSPDNVP